MELNEYQERAMRTCMSSCNNITYMLANLVGEAGEFSSKFAKAIRKGQADIDHNQLIFWRSDEEHELKKEMMKEAGDILWQLSGLCSVMGWPLEEVAKQNLDKLASRQERGVIDGNGDNR